MKGNENQIRCMAKEFLPGLMEEYTKESIIKIKRTVRDILNGQMEEATKDNGKMENSMEWVGIWKIMKVKNYKEVGLKVK